MANKPTAHGGALVGAGRPSRAAQGLGEPSKYGVTLDPDQALYVEQRAAEEGAKPAAVIRDIVAEALTRQMRAAVARLRRSRKPRKSRR